MDFDWNYFESATATQAEITEIFEDPFSLRFMPDAERFASQARFFIIGRSMNGKLWFVVYTSTGRLVRVITARPGTPEETYYYDRKIKEEL